MGTSSRFFNASLRKSLKVLKSYPGGRSNRRFRERKRRETAPHRRTGRARQRPGRANGGGGIEYVLNLLQFASGLNRGFLIFGRQYDAFGRDNLPELLYPRLSVLHQPREEDAQAGVYQYRAGVRQGNALHDFDRLFPRALERRVRLREVTDAVANGRSLTLEVVRRLALRRGRRTALGITWITRRFGRRQNRFRDNDATARKRLVVVAPSRAQERRVGLGKVTEIVTKSAHDVREYLVGLILIDTGAKGSGLVGG